MLFEHNFLSNSFNFSKKIDLLLRMRIANNVKCYYVNRLKFRDTVFTSLTKLVVEAKSVSVLLFYSWDFLIFTLAVIV